MKIDHLGIAVRSISDSLRFYREALGLELAGSETVEDQGVKVALLPAGRWRAYRERWAEAFGLLDPLAERLGYAL